MLRLDYRAAREARERVLWVGTSGQSREIAIRRVCVI